MRSLEELGYSKDRDPVQIDEIKRGLEKAISAEKNPQIVTSPYGSGKTVTIAILAFSLVKIVPDAKVMVAVLTKYEAERMKKELEQNGLSVGQCLTVDETRKPFEARVTIITHEMLAVFGNQGRQSELKEYYLFMDEDDRFSQKHPLGFKDSKLIMKSVKFFYGTSAHELTAEDKGEEGMDCPANTEFVVLERTGNT